MTKGVPIADLQTIFVGGTALSNAPWIGNFINSIHEVYYLSTAFLLIGIIPSVLRGPSPHRGEVGGGRARRKPSLAECMRGLEWTCVRTL